MLESMYGAVVACPPLRVHEKSSLVANMRCTILIMCGLVKLLAHSAARLLPTALHYSSCSTSTSAAGASLPGRRSLAVEPGAWG